MSEISYITQGNQQLNLKDANGRALVSKKQTKLKSGNGINISEDGRISSVFKDGIANKIRVSKFYGFYDHGEKYSVDRPWLYWKGNKNLAETHEKKVYAIMMEDCLNINKKGYFLKGQEFNQMSYGQEHGYRNFDMLFANWSNNGSIWGGQYGGFHLCFLNKKTGKLAPYADLTDYNLEDFVICLGCVDYGEYSETWEFAQPVYVQEICNATDANVDEEIFNAYVFEEEGGN
jgi:hypothetical protein